MRRAYAPRDVRLLRRSQDQKPLAGAASVVSQRFVRKSQWLADVILTAQSKTNRQIAAELYLSEHTVKTYVSSLLKKQQARDSNELAPV